MSKFKRLEEKSDQKKFLLTKTKELSTTTKNWEKFLLSEYEKNQNSHHNLRKNISIVNSIFYHNRAVFSFRKNDLRDLFNNDKNWNIKLGLKSSDYKKVIKELHDTGLIKTIFRGGHKQLSVYEVIDPDILRLLDVNVENQKTEVLDFVLNRKFNEIKNKLESQDEEDNGNPLLERVLERYIERIKENIFPHLDYLFYDCATDVSVDINYDIKNDLHHGTYDLPLTGSKDSKVCKTSPALLNGINWLKSELESSFLEILMGESSYRNAKLRNISFEDVYNTFFPNGFGCFQDVDDYIRICEFNNAFILQDISQLEFKEILTRNRTYSDLISSYFLKKLNKKKNNCYLMDSNSSYQTNKVELDV